MPLWTDYGHGFVKVKAARSDNPNAAFLCCPGPSLANIGDLRGIGRTVYALNTAYPKVKPDVWIGLDRMACFDPGLWDESFPKVTRYFDNDNGLMRHKPNVFYADLEDSVPSQIFIRRDNDSKFVWQKNSFIFALNYLLWCGHKRIYFIGCDMGGSKDYYDSRVLTEEQHGNNRRLYEDLTETMRKLTPLAARNGVEFVCATPGSPLGHFMQQRTVEQAVFESERTKLQNNRTPVHVFEADKKIDRSVVLVLKSGGDFRPEHVERLVKQLPHCTVTLATDYPAHFFQGVRVVPLKYNWPGWWSKLEIFSPEFILADRPFLYLDLDATIYDLPDGFFTHSYSVVMAPYRNTDKRKGGEIDTNVMLLHPQERSKVWNRWRENPKKWMKDHWNEQSFMASCPVRWQLWQDLFPDAIVSYKLNILTGKNYSGKPLDESRIKILAYHGKPRPWEVEKQPHENNGTTPKRSRRRSHRASARV